MQVQTERHMSSASSVSVPSERDKLVGELLEQVQGLKSMLSQAVKAWGPTTQQTREDRSADLNLSVLEGSWVDRVTGSHLYAKLVGNELVVPYCYAGYDELTGVFYGWKKDGRILVTRFCWMRKDISGKDISGFAFLKQESIDVMSGWWCNEEGDKIPDAPIHGLGVPFYGERARADAFPSWAVKFLDEVHHEGLATRLTKR